MLINPIPKVFVDAFKKEPVYKTDPTTPTPVRAKSYRITADPRNYNQIIETIKAYKRAGMPFEHVANAGEEIGEIVERAEIDAPVNQISEASEGIIDRSQALFWQNRGEVITITPQISAPNNLSGNELTQTTSNLVQDAQSAELKLNVVEGIGVFNQEAQGLQNASSNNTSLENNPFLTAPANLKKAA